MLEGQGYEVKGEIGAADVVAVRGTEDPVIIELKTNFSLSLFHQAIERQTISDLIYVAVPRGEGKRFLKSLRSNKLLCRRLGLGLITVRMKDGFVEIHIDPSPYKPRQSAQKKAKLLREFAKRVGDPNTGGATRGKLVTAYRQDALRCLKILSDSGPTKAAVVAKLTTVKNAQRIMSDDYYGWFERVSIGIYALSPIGFQALDQYTAELNALEVS